MTSPRRRGRLFLIAGAGCSAVAALVHVACIPIGGAAYRALGAGEGMAQLADAGDWRPSAMAAAIAAILFVWSAYALSGAGSIRRLPLLRTGLCAITAVYLLRGIGFVAIMPRFPDNSMTFWVVSSAICLAIGLVHAAGLRGLWTPHEAGASRANPPRSEAAR